jgi:uncharacterized protein (TIGR04255 family)
VGGIPKAVSKNRGAWTSSSTIELFGVPNVPKNGVELQVSGKPPVPRCWFLNDSGSELLQVQQDRFIHNWRRTEHADVYPRYTHISDTFREELDVFRKFVESEKVGEFTPNQCEVTYVNHIPSGSAWHQLGEIAKVISTITADYSDDFLPAPEEAQFTARYVIPNDGGSPLGRLRIAADPAYRISDRHPIFVLQLTARGAPVGAGVEGVLHFLDVGHEWVVRGFASITTKLMHEVWGRKDIATS